MLTIETKFGVLDKAEDVERGFYLGKTVVRNNRKTKPTQSHESLLMSAINFIHLQGFDMVKSVRMLNAHGNSDNGVFEYTHYPKGDLEWGLVSDWIKKHDGKYDALVVLSCNTGEIQMESRASILMYPRGYASDFAVLNASSDRIEDGNSTVTFLNGSLGEQEFALHLPLS